MGVVLVVCAAVGILAAPAAAPAQSSGTSQYTPNIGTAGSTASGGSGKTKDPNDGAAGTQASGVAGTAQPGGGSLAFTGYPLTWLVLIVAILLGTGLVARVIAPRLDRRYI